MSNNKVNTAVLVDKFKGRFGNKIIETKVEFGEVTHVVAKDDLLGVLTILKGDGDFMMDWLSDVVGVDYLPKKPRFELVYHLLSTKKKHRIRIKIRVEDGEEIPSVTSIWAGASFAEREAYDMFGFIFKGHPDLRRIYLAEDWEGHPLRKDYPLRGYKDEYNPNGVDPKGK